MGKPRFCYPVVSVADEEAVIKVGDKLYAVL